MFSEFAAGWVATLVANALVACCLAAAGWLVWRWRQNAPIAHALMLLALLKLVAPPLFDCGLGWDFGLAPVSAPVGGEVVWVAEPVGPRDGSGASEAAVSPSGSTSRGVPGDLPLFAGSGSEQSSIGSWIFLVWALGAAATSLVIWRRARHCRALLERADEAPSAVRATVESLGRSLGLRSAPAVRVVCAPVMPFVCSVRGTMTVILPLDLLGRVRAEDLQAVLAHELAHVANRDHWVRRLELVACIVHWWNPISWRIRSALSAIGEHRCDARAVEILNSGSRRYGRALLRVTSSLAPSGPPLPILASGLGGASVLKQRLTMIAEDKLSHRLSFSARCALLLGASALLPLGLVGQGPDRKGGDAFDKAAVRKAVLEALSERGIEIGGIEKKLDAALENAGASQGKQKKLKRQKETETVFGHWIEQGASGDGDGKGKSLGHWARLQGGDHKAETKTEWKDLWAGVNKQGKGKSGRWVAGSGDGAKKVLMWTNKEGKPTWHVVRGDGKHASFFLRGGEGEKEALIELKRAVDKDGKESGSSFFSSDDSAQANKRCRFGLKKAMAEGDAKAGKSDRANPFVAFGDGDAQKKAWVRVKRAMSSKGKGAEHDVFLIKGDDFYAKKKGAVVEVQRGGENHFFVLRGDGEEVRLRVSDRDGTKSEDVDFFVKPGSGVTERRFSVGGKDGFMVIRDGDSDSATADRFGLRMERRVERAPDGDGHNWKAGERGEDVRAIKAKIKALKRKLKALQKASGGKRKKSGKTMV